MLDINIITCMIIRTNQVKSISPKMNRLIVIIIQAYCYNNNVYA